ncbi:hypothetical protein Ancab_033453 [Ancistrocladus abbreviatus]
MNKVLAIFGPLLTGVAAIGSAFVGRRAPWAVVVVALVGSLASIVNTIEHGAQVGMVFEMYRNSTGFFKLLEETIESTLEEEELVSSGADPNWQGFAFNRLGDASNRSDAAAEVGGDIEDTNRMVRKKSLDDILYTSPRNSKTGKRIKCKSRNEVGVIPHSDDISLLEAAQSKSDSRLAVNNSQILNMNRLHCITSTSRQSPPCLTPQQIWDFIEQIGVRDKTNIKDVVRRIGEMEQRDWMAFQKLASAGQQNEARREVSSSK